MVSSTTSKRRVYLDYAATTPMDPRVVAAMIGCTDLQGDFANPSSTAHDLGLAARARIEHARAQAANLIGATDSAIVWTSGATEANNLAILGAARFNGLGERKHIVTARTEHKAVLDPCKRLEKEGYSVTYLTPDKQGQVSPEQVAAALRPQTVLVSLMHVNNETGVIQDVAAVGAICRARGVLFHVDAAQSAGRIPIDVEAGCIDLLSISAHKLYGPKGIGALYVRQKPPLGLLPLMFGGGQENGLRPGTLPTHQIVAFGEACALLRTEMAVEAQRLTGLRDRLWEALASLGGVHLNGAPQRVPHILNVSFENVEGESLLLSLNEIAVSSGAACSSASQDASYVLRALGRSDALAQASLRFSLGRYTTSADVDTAIATVRREVLRLRALHPANPPPLTGAGVLRGEAGSVEQGVWVKFFLQTDGDYVAAASAQVYGCPQTVAAVHWLLERLPGKALAKIVFASPREIADTLHIPETKLGRLLVVEDALRACASPHSGRNAAF